MTKTIKTLLDWVLADQATPSTHSVHFHRGPHGGPAVCERMNCTQPHLDDFA